MQAFDLIFLFKLQPLSRQRLTFLNKYDIFKQEKVQKERVIFIFDPKTKKFPYPIDTSSHYITVKKDDKTVFDKNYPYVDDSFSMRARQFLVRILLYTVVFPAARVRLGLRIHGRKNLKKHKEMVDW